MKLIILLIIAIIVILVCRNMNKEGWVPYKSCPFGNVEMAPNSQIYYIRRRYRKPLYWPFKFNSSYPIQHKRHFEQKY